MSLGGKHPLSRPDESDLLLKAEMLPRNLTPRAKNRFGFPWFAFTSHIDTFCSDNPE